MITFKALGQWGRLGNQMFQYSTLYSVGKKNNYEIGIPYVVKSNNAYCNIFLDECFENLSAKDCTNTETLFDYIEPYPNINFNSEIFKINDNTNIHGYFQSEKYFVEYKNDILNEFKFKKHIEEQSNNIKNLIKDEIVSVHMRIGDYAFLTDKHPICSPDYYEKAFDLVPKNKTVLLFSDNLTIAYETMKKFSDKIIIPETNNDFIDLCLMSKCDYHIIANSSYSWWGAWLSKSKQVIAPQKWFGDSNDMPKDWSDIYCEGWKVV